jgi:1-acyl-sn-glycerol-3-phosphate acyltransferase
MERNAASGFAPERCAPEDRARSGPASPRSGSRPQLRDRLALAVQRAVGAALAPLWFPTIVGAMRFGVRWRIEDAATLRRDYALLRRSGRPLVVCANHLTLVDSAVIAWALGSPAWFLAHYASLPWNVPERANFASSLVSRVLVYVMKCVPVVRGGDRRDVGRVLTRLSWLVSRGEVVLMFPEGGRSRTGRVEEDSAAYGVGRLVATVPGCRVLCVYLRGRHQDGPGDLAVRGESFVVRSELLEPRTLHQGMRAARDVSQQIIAKLRRLEAEHFAERAADRLPGESAGRRAA